MRQYARETAERSQVFRQMLLDGKWKPPQSRNVQHEGQDMQVFQVFHASSSSSHEPVQGEVEIHNQKEKLELGRLVFKDCRKKGDG